MPALRQAAPEPIAEIHPNTAQEYSIANGSILVIKTRKGEIKECQNN